MHSGLTLDHLLILGVSRRLSLERLLVEGARDA